MIKEKVTWETEVADGNVCSEMIAQFAKYEASFRCTSVSEWLSVGSSLPPNRLYNQIKCCFIDSKGIILPVK